MESRNRYTGMPPCAVNSVRHQARKLAKSHGFLPADVEDIEQEMMIHLHRQIPRYDDAKSSTATFFSRLIGNHAISLQRSAMAYGLGALPPRWRVTGFSTTFLPVNGPCVPVIGIPVPSSPRPDHGRLS